MAVGNSGLGGAKILPHGNIVADVEETTYADVAQHGLSNTAPNIAPATVVNLVGISGVLSPTYIEYPTNYPSVTVVDANTLFMRTGVVWLRGLPSTERHARTIYTRFVGAPAQAALVWGLDQEWEYGEGFSVWALDAEWSTALRDAYSRDLDSSWALGNELHERSLDTHYATAGSVLLDAFLTQINDARALAGVAPVSLYRYPSVDIATRHSVNVRAYDVYEHESPLLPIGWQTTSQRMARLSVPTQAHAENLAVAEAPAGVEIQAAVWFNAWLNSPPHYANMVTDFGDNRDVRLLLGVEFFAELTAAPHAQGNYTQFATLNLVDLSSKDTFVEEQRQLGMQWGLQGSYIEALGMSWSTYAYSHVAARHDSTYALRVTSSLSTPYGVFAAAQHSVPLYYTVSRHHATAYAATLPAAARHYGTYDIAEYARVRASHTEEWRIRVAAISDTTYAGSLVPRVWHATEYHDAPRVRNALYTAYDSLPRVRRYHDSTYDPAYVARASHADLYSLLPRALASHRVLYGDQIPVSAGLDTRYNLSLRNPVVAQSLTFYAIISEAATVFSQQCLVYVRGREIDCNSFSVRMDEGDASWSMDIDIADVAQYANIRREDAVTIDYCGETFVGFVDSKSIARDDPANVTMSITCRSPIARYDAPYAELVNYTVTAPTEARAVVEELLGSAVDWRIVNWLIPPYRFAATQQSPLAIAKMLVEVAGGVIESNPDGSLYVRYWYPVSAPAFSTTAPGLVLTDIEDNVSQRDRRYKAEVFNSFRVREDNSLMSDRIEWVPDDNDGLNGTLRVYLEPWRTTAELRHTDDITYPLLPLGVRAREEEDVVEFLDGEGKLQNPATAIVSYRWESESLGAISLDLRTSTVRAADTSVNYGYGVATIKYVVETLDYRAQIPADSPIQYIVVDKGE